MANAISVDVIGDQLHDAAPLLAETACPSEGVSSPTISSPSPITPGSIQQHLSPSREIITLDDSSDRSISLNPISPIVRLRSDETVYLTPDTTKSRRKTTSPESTPPYEGAYILEQQHTSEAQAAAEAVFSTHKRTLQVLSEERDGWKKLCEDLMARQEAEMAVSNANSQSTQLQWSPASRHPLAEGPDSASATQSFPAAKNIVLLQDELQDMQIRMEAKQRESEEERAKAERWEMMYTMQSRAVEDLHHDKERYIRDARDVDVRLELYARERENKGEPLFAERNIWPC